MFFFSHSFSTTFAMLMFCVWLLLLDVVWLIRLDDVVCGESKSESHSDTTKKSELFFVLLLFSSLWTENSQIFFYINKSFILIENLWFLLLFVFGNFSLSDYSIYFTLSLFTGDYTFFCLHYKLFRGFDLDSILSYLSD